MLTARTIQPSPTSRTLTQPGACSKWPRNIRSPVSAWERIARLTAPWSTSSTVSQSGSATSRSSAGMTRSNSSPMVSPPRNGLSFGTTPRNACTKACSSSRRRDRREPVAAELLQLRPDLRRRVRGNELGRLHRPRQPACDHAVERDPREQPARRLCLGSSLVGQRNGLGRHGPAGVVEVGHRAVAHEVDPAAGGLGHR